MTTAEARPVSKLSEARQQTLSFGAALAEATAQALAEEPRAFVYGEGINDPGGFFGSTVGLKDRVGEARCFDVPNSEESLVGFGIGAALMGMRPLFVNLRVEFLMLAMNQLVNHAARLPAMSGYQYTIPLMIRAIVGKSWGQGAQHASAPHSLFANVPGLQVVAPGSVADAAGLLLSALRGDAPTVMIELKSLYETRAAVELPFAPVPIGQAALLREGGDITCIAISDMVAFALRTADRLAARGIEADVLDLRSVAPLDREAVVASVRKTRRVAVFDIGWEPFGLAAEIARVVTTSDAYRLAAPLISIARAFEQTPASCFLERAHYPQEDAAVERIAELLRTEGRA